MCLLDLARRLVIAPVALQQVRAAPPYLAVCGENNVHAFDRRTDASGPGERPALACDNAASLFGLSVHFDDVDTVDLPKRSGFGGQRGAAADDQLEPIKAEL